MQTRERFKKAALERIELHGNITRSLAAINAEIDAAETDYERKVLGRIRALLRRMLSEKRAMAIIIN